MKKSDGTACSCEKYQKMAEKEFAKIWPSLNKSDKKERETAKISIRRGLFHRKERHFFNLRKENNHKSKRKRHRLIRNDKRVVRCPFF
jgi:hypothetical protein